VNLVLLIPAALLMVGTLTAAVAMMLGRADRPLLPVRAAAVAAFVAVTVAAAVTGTYGLRATALLVAAVALYALAGGESETA